MSYFRGLTVEERVHEWVDFSLRDAPQGPEDVRELLLHAAALRRLGVDPVAILQKGHGVQDAGSVAKEASGLRKVWIADQD